MSNVEFNDNELIVNLTIDGSSYEEVEVKVSDPHKTIREQIQSIINVFELPKTDCGGNPIRYLLGQMLEDGEEPVILDFEDEEGKEQSLLDYDIKKGDHLHLTSVPLYGCPMPDEGETNFPVKDESKGKDQNHKPFWRHILYGCWL